MTLLYNLPAEILSGITSSLHVFDVANLCLTGSTLLNSKLANGGVSQLEVVFEPKLRAFKWPSLFSALAHLTYFSLWDAYDSTVACVSSAHLETLSKRLQELHIYCFGGFHALNDLLLRNPDCFPTLKKLVVSMRAQDKPVDRKQLCIWPKTLESLRLSIPDGREFPLDLSALPPQLTYLNGTFSEILASSMKTGFPKTLNGLYLTLFQFVDILPLLPRGLEYLMFNHAPFYRTKDLDIEKSEQGRRYREWKKSGICNLPPGLKTIQLPIFDYTRDILLQLPPTITTILHYDSTGIPTENFQFLPPLLSNGSRLFPYFIDQEIAKRLPKTLTSIQAVVEVNAIPFLNPNIADISIRESRPDSKAFESLGIDIVPIQTRSMDINRTGIIPFSALPKCLTTLAFHEGSLTSKDLEALPRTLKNLSITSIEGKNPSQHWKLLPENLEDFTLTQPTTTSTESSTFLPRRLVALYLYECTTVTQAWFEGLPPTLTRFSADVVNFEGPFTGKITWPQSLADIRMIVRQHTLDSETMSNILRTIPRAVTSLELDWAMLRQPFKISNQDLARLSKRLSFLSLHRTSLR